MSESAISERLRGELRKRFGATPEEIRIVRAPLRVCPLGAHIDHQQGTVTAMAIDRAVHLAYVAAPDAVVRLTSLSFPGEARFTLDNIPPARDADWANYARGAASALSTREVLNRGILGVTEGAHGEGGLSSSAAVGVAYLMALEEANGLAPSKDENVELDRLIENDYLGLRNGILDQSAILHSRKDHLTVIDCRNGTSRTIQRRPQMPAFKILVVFSGIRQALTTTGYNMRVSECVEAAAGLLKASGRPIDEPNFLGDVTPEEYAEHSHVLKGAAAKRARHFFTECDRVRRGLIAWEAGDLEAFGCLITESGRSSIENYECGSEPLIDLYDILRRQKGVFGTRFSGAGFRGCCVALVNSENAEDIRRRVASAYARRHPDLAAEAPSFVCDIDDGARFIEP